jgi:predicted lipoprotein with Yx(FWY)xxD motif
VPGGAQASRRRRSCWLELGLAARQGQVTVERAELGRLGTVLVTNKGFALYTFPPDAAQHVTCTGDCASGWPPLKLHTGQTAATGAG